MGTCAASVLRREGGDLIGSRRSGFWWRANWIKCSRRGIIARAPGVSKTAPSATKAFCMSMTIRAQLRGSMVKKFFPEVLRLEDTASPSVYLSHRPRTYDIAGLAEDQLFSSCQAFDG